MKAIMVEFKDGHRAFVAEVGQCIGFVDGLAGAFWYRDLVEFRVTWRVMDVWRGFRLDPGVRRKEDVGRFVCIDGDTLVQEEFDVSGSWGGVGDVLHFPRPLFRVLMDCPVSCSHWLYADDGEWIAFPQAGDFGRVAKIRYYARGLCFHIEGMGSARNGLHWAWPDRHSDSLWSGYVKYRPLILDPTLQQVFLMGLPACHEFMVYPIPAATSPSPDA